MLKIEDCSKHQNINTKKLILSPKIKNPLKNENVNLIETQRKVLSQRQDRSASLPRIHQKPQKKELHQTKIIIDLEKEYEEDRELLALFEDKPLQKDNNEQSITGNITNRIKPLCEIIPEEDEDKQKTGNNFFNRITKPMKGNSFITYPVSKIFKQIHIKESPFGSNYNNVVTPLGCINIGTRQNNFESRQKETIAKLILPSPCSPYRTNRTPLDNNINIESPSTSEFTHDSLVKKLSNDTKSIDDNTKERMHLFSAQYSYNIHLNKNNTIFPKGNRRPLSNLNNGGSNLYENIERKYNSKPCSQKAKLRNSKKDNILFRGNNNLFNSNDSIHFNDNKYSVSSKKFHKIKVERGMMSTKFVDTLTNKLHFDLSTQTFKRGNILANSMNFIP